MIAPVCLVLDGSVRCRTLLLFSFLTMNGQWRELLVRVFSWEVLTTAHSWLKMMIKQTENVKTQFEQLFTLKFYIGFLLSKTLYPRGLRFLVPLNKGNEGSGNGGSGNELGRGEDSREISREFSCACPVE